MKRAKREITKSIAIIICISEGQGRKKITDNIFEKKMAKNVSNLMKEVAIQL